VHVHVLLLVRFHHMLRCSDLITTREANPPSWTNQYKCYDPKGDHSHDERVWAAVELYAATGEQKYHTYFLERHCPRWGNDPSNLSLEVIWKSALFIPLFACNGGPVNPEK
jgi:hypothetical protein